METIENKGAVTGALTLSKTDQGEVDGDLLPRSPMDNDAFTLERPLKSTGKRWDFKCTDLMRRFRFAADPNVGFVPERVVCFVIAHA